MTEEDKLKQSLISNIEDFLEEKFPEKDLEVDEEVPIIKDCTFVYEEGEFSMYLGHAKADIAIYIKSKNLTNQLEETDTLKLYQNGSKEINIPLAVIETKRGSDKEKITTDSIRSRTIIAREMNEIFPHSSYIFIADNAGKVTPGKLERAGKHFDHILTTKGKADQKWIEEEIITEIIETHLDKVAESGLL